MQRKIILYYDIPPPQLRRSPLLRLRDILLSLFNSRMLTGRLRYVCPRNLSWGRLFDSGSIPVEGMAEAPTTKAPATKAPVTKAPDDKNPRRQKPQTTKAPDDKSPRRQKPQTTKAPDDKNPRRHKPQSVTGKFLLRKFHLGKFYLENSSYGKFLLWKNNVAGNSGMPLSANL